MERHVDRFGAALAARLFIGAFVGGMLGALGAKFTGSPYLVAIGVLGGAVIGFVFVVQRLRKRG